MKNLLSSTFRYPREDQFIIRVGDVTAIRAEIVFKKAVILHILLTIAVSAVVTCNIVVIFKAAFANITTAANPCHHLLVRVEYFSAFFATLVSS